MKSCLQRKPLLILGTAFLALATLLLSTCCLQKIQKPQEVVESKVELVAGFPEFPVAAGAQLESSSKEGQGNQIKYLATWKVNGSVPQLMDWYIITLSDGPWEIEEFPFDPGALGQQSAQVSVDEWRANFTLREEYPGEPIRIRVEIVPKEI